MALVVEDGTGLGNADSYISQANADTYFTNHGSPSAWTGASSGAKEAALRYAARWLDANYTWVGTLKNLTTPQSLGWPRIGVVDDEYRVYPDDEVPALVIEAQCEMALAHVTKSIAAPQSQGDAIKSVQAGSVAVVYKDSAPAGRTYDMVNGLLRGLGRSKGSGLVDVFRS